ncbi:gp100 [Rhodococcus phage ReqiPepy6]|uniref:Gp100 n=1 Tax=Rhodococcus phage ReqiPepy6 TaxID=691965 RepID=D4P7L1_9CAUD|nr:gp100 [Rhodococcus phage ReqiPepy6]ADD80991.1 gp100 [Rhodococcus phage ReqiPepy6]
MGNAQSCEVGVSRLHRGAQRRMKNTSYDENPLTKPDSGPQLRSRSLVGFRLPYQPYIFVIGYGLANL